MERDMIHADLVTVIHNDTQQAQLDRLRGQLAEHEPDGGYRLIAVYNRTRARGFARACNLGALHPEVDAPVIGFLDPDLHITGPFLAAVTATLSDPVIITGARFDKPDSELRSWGVRDWVSNSALFVQRRWFAATDGYDEQFTWGWQDTDLIRRAERQGLRCQPADLRLHLETSTDTAQDARYKHTSYSRGAQSYYRKWGR
jgi:GT2 family glycosyltransferase